MPLFILTAMLLAMLIHLSVVAMALHGAVSQGVRQAASLWYPISVGLDSVRSTPMYAQYEQAQTQLSGIGEMLAEYADWLPSPLSDWANQAANGQWSPEETAARLAFREHVAGFADSRVLDGDRLEVTDAEWPDADDPERAFVSVTASYRLPFSVPFTGRPIIIRASARERAWIGGMPSASRRGTDTGTGQEADIVFVSLDPDPVRPGRKATLMVRTSPGASASLTILYKSGMSQAKHLGAAVAGEDGRISWTWHVSGRTTPGMWELQVTDAGGRIWRRAFEVAGAGGKGGDAR